MKFTTVTWYSQLTAIVVAVVIFGAGIFVGSRIETDKADIRQSEENLLETNVLDTGNPAAGPTKVTAFEWRYDIVSSTAEYPKTAVTLFVRREGKVIDQKPIATVDGSCNPVLVETLLALNSEQLQCYYAGFGYQFRVIESETGYNVQQKEIEEASPDYNPPISEFITIITIPKGGDR